MPDLNETLAERSRYGDFAEMCKIIQELKHCMKYRHMQKLKPYQQEALEMIAVKIGRILAGDANYADNWHDIAGYAKLVEDRLPKPDFSAGKVTISFETEEEEEKTTITGKPMCKWRNCKNWTGLDKRGYCLFHSSLTPEE
jgi:hypothetical protein